MPRKSFPWTLYKSVAWLQQKPLQPTDGLFFVLFHPFPLSSRLPCCSPYYGVLNSCYTYQSKALKTGGSSRMLKTKHREARPLNRNSSRYNLFVSGAHLFPLLPLCRRVSVYRAKMSLAIQKKIISASLEKPCVLQTLQKKVFRKRISYLYLSLKHSPMRTEFFFCGYVNAGGREGGN